MLGTRLSLLPGKTPLVLLLHAFDDGSKTRTEYGSRMGGNSRSTGEAQRLIDADLAR